MLFNPPDSLILLSIDHCVFNGFVHQCVHVRCEGVDGFRQRFAALGEKPLSVCIYAKLQLVFILQRKCKVSMTHRDIKATSMGTIAG